MTPFLPKVGKINENQDASAPKVIAERWGLPSYLVMIDSTSLYPDAGREGMGLAGPPLPTPKEFQGKLRRNIEIYREIHRYVCFDVFRISFLLGRCWQMLAGGHSAYSTPSGSRDLEGMFGRGQSWTV